MSEGLNVVVLAGGKNSPEMQAATGVTNRALVLLGEKTMLDYVVDALGAASSVVRVFVVGNVPPDARYQQIPGGETLMDNLLAGLRAANSEGANGRVLIATSDTPFLTPGSVDFFISQSLEANADFCYPIVPIDLCRQQFPQMKRTTLRLGEGTFTGGNLMLVNPAYIFAHEQLIQQAYAARKSVSRISRLLGPGLLVRILLAQTLFPRLLTLAAMEAGVSRLLGPGSRARAIVTPYPEIGTDVDKPDDVAVARRMLAK